MIYFLQLSLALTLDALVGDPHWYPHPVKIIGRFIEWSERLTRAVFHRPLHAGIVTVLLVLIFTGAGCGVLLLLCGIASPILAAAVAIFFVYTGIAARDLFVHSLAVYKALTGADSLEKARLEVAKIVGRDTSRLSREGVCRACIETVAENMVDGITAPLFWALVASRFSMVTPLSPIECSALGIMMYKAVNTMDSMIGYKNEKYLLFGRAAARLDDIVNFLPARISGLCVIAAAFLIKLDGRHAATVFFRDRYKHTSPNAGHTEAAVAGALHLRLGGPQSYFGKIVEKPYIGDDDREPVAQDIKQVNRLVIAASGVFLLLSCCILSVCI
jgi:adenosylcobinamide-phosphate synthase